MKETEKTKALRALIIRRAGQKCGYVREKGSYSEGTMFKLIKELALKKRRIGQKTHYFLNEELADVFFSQNAAKPRARHKAATQSIKSKPQQHVEIINNVTVKVHPYPEYRLLVMSRDCRMAPESRAVYCSVPVLENL